MSNLSTRNPPMSNQCDDDADFVIVPNNLPPVPEHPNMLSNSLAIVHRPKLALAPVPASVYNVMSKTAVGLRDATTDLWYAYAKSGANYGQKFTRWLGWR